MVLIRAKHNKNRDVDELFERFINNFVKPSVTKKDDDVLVLCVGKTGSGKSMLMLHGYEIYAGDEASIEYVSFNRNNLADNMYKCRYVSKGFRFNGYDEANVSKRDALSQFNKALLDVYYSIRGLNIFHWWNNPSIDMIDKPFIVDRVTGLFLITTHSVDRPRVYYYFEKNKLLDIFKKYGNLNYETLNKVKRKYAKYKGWFRDYTGFLKQHYLDKKNPRMEEKLLDFKNKFGTLTDEGGEKVYTLVEVRRLTGYANNTLATYRRNGTLPRDSWYMENNKVFYRESALKLLYDRKKGEGIKRAGLPTLDNGFKETMEEKDKEVFNHG